MDNEELASLISAGTAVYDRIRTNAKKMGRDPQFVRRCFVYQRLIERINASEWRDRWLTLKGGLLVVTLDPGMGRVTDDLDFTASTPVVLEDAKDALRTICGMRPPQIDGLTFQVDDGRCRMIWEQEHRQTARIYVTATLHCRYKSVTDDLKLDVAHGDVMTPGVSRVALEPLCRGFEPPVFPAYPWETVLAEKLHTIQRQGAANGRLRDFWDIIAITRRLPLSGTTLADAVRATYACRDSAIETQPFGLTEAFADSKAEMWANLLKRPGMSRHAPAAFRDAVDEVGRFAWPLLAAAASGTAAGVDWAPAGGWQPPAGEVAAPSAGPR
jgi:predicted nucleotidyltransferase component of viral defense system